MQVPDGWLHEQFALDGQVAVVTGGAGVLGGAIARGLARAGARVAILGRDQGRAERAAAASVAGGDDAVGIAADVLNRAQLERARDSLVERWDRVDILINAAGGNVSGATVPPGGSIFDLPLEAFREVVELNLLGSVLPSQVFGAVMAEAGRGSIVNISSMSCGSGHLPGSWILGRKVRD